MYGKFRFINSFEVNVSAFPCFREDNFMLYYIIFFFFLSNSFYLFLASRNEYIINFQFLNQILNEWTISESHLNHSAHLYAHFSTSHTLSLSPSWCCHLFLLIIMSHDVISNYLSSINFFITIIITIILVYI